jgi:hypothetical protein
MTMNRILYNAGVMAALAALVAVLGAPAKWR